MCASVFVVLCERTYELLCYPISHVCNHICSPRQDRQARDMQRISCSTCRQKLGVAPKRRGDAQQARGRHARGQAPKSTLVSVSRDILTVVKTKTALLGYLSGVASPFLVNYCARPCPSRQPPQAIRDPYDAKLFRDRTHHVVRAGRSMAMASTRVGSSESSAALL
jgi:hypothetical protein